MSAHGATELRVEDLGRAAGGTVDGRWVLRRKRANIPAFMDNLALGYWPPKRSVRLGTRDFSAARTCRGGFSSTQPAVPVGSEPSGLNLRRTRT